MVEARDPLLYLTDSIFKEVRELEEYFLTRDTIHGRIYQSGLMNYALLPQTLTAKGIEQCANHYTDLTNKSVNSNERGGWSHLQSVPRKLLYPINPSVGLIETEDGISSYRVTPEMFVTDNIYPFGFIHGHPGNEPPSTTDISLVTGSHQEIYALICVAGAKKFNYLMLATQETIKESPGEMTERFISLYPNFKSRRLSSN